MEHKNASINKRHAPNNWTVLTIAELSTLTVGAEDVEKTAYIKNDGTGNPTTYILTNYDPPTWKPSVSGTGTGGAVTPTASPTVLGGVKVGAGLAIDGVGLLSVTGGGTSAKTVQSTTTNTVSTESVTMINLPELTVTLAANSTYEIEGFLPLQQSNTNGYALQFVTPSDCQPFYEISPAINAGTSATQGHLYSATAGTVTTTTGSVSAATTTMVPHVKAIIKTVSAGTLNFNFRYNGGATAGTTTILAGATIVVEKIQ